MSQSKIPRTLSVFALAMINLAAVGSVKNWPVTAEYGFASIFYLLLAAVLFFIPRLFGLCRACNRLAKIGRRICLGERGLWPPNWLFGDLAPLD